MNIISKFFKTRQQRKAFRKFLDKHKKNILKAYYEMLNCQDLEWIMQDPVMLDILWERILTHDDSKYEEDEFEYYRKHYFPIDKKEYIENEKEFEDVWFRHIHNNDHHWQARTDWEDEYFDINTEAACLENIIDWLAVGYELNDRPIDYYEAHKDEIDLPPKQIQFIERCIYQGIDKDYIEMRNNIYDVWNRV